LTIGVCSTWKAVAAASRENLTRSGLLAHACTLTGRRPQGGEGRKWMLPILTVCYFPNETPFCAHSAHSAHTLLGLLHRNPLRKSLVRHKKLCALCALLPLSGVEFCERRRLPFGQLLERRLAAELLGKEHLGRTR